jgi:hypothetical protein
MHPPARFTHIDYSVLLVAEDAMMCTMNLEIPRPPSWVLLPLLLPGEQALMEIPSVVSRLR